MRSQRTGVGSTAIGTILVSWNGCQLSTGLGTSGSPRPMALPNGSGVEAGDTKASYPHRGRARQPLVLLLFERPDEAVYPRIVHSVREPEKALRVDLGSDCNHDAQVVAKSKVDRRETGWREARSVDLRKARKPSIGFPTRQAESEKSSGCVNSFTTMH